LDRHRDYLHRSSRTVGKRAVVNRFEIEGCVVSPVLPIQFGGVPAKASALFLTE